MTMLPQQVAQSDQITLTGGTRRTVYVVATDLTIADTAAVLEVGFPTVPTGELWQFERLLLRVGYDITFSAGAGGRQSLTAPDADVFGLDLFTVRDGADTPTPAPAFWPTTFAAIYPGRGVWTIADALPIAVPSNQQLRARLQLRPRADPTRISLGVTAQIRSYAAG